MKRNAALGGCSQIAQSVHFRPKADICCADLDSRRLKSISSRWEILDNSDSRLN